MFGRSSIHGSVAVPVRTTYNRRVIPRAAMALAAVLLAACYSSYQRTSAHDAAVDDGSEVTCSIRERGPRVEVGIDAPTSTHHHYDFAWAGDGYAAILAMGYLSGWPPARILRRATRFAAAVCGLAGAVPEDPAFYQPFLGWAEDGGDR